MLQLHNYCIHVHEGSIMFLVHRPIHANGNQIWKWVTPVDPLTHPDLTNISLTCWSVLYKVMQNYMKKSVMKQCHLCRIKNRSMYRILENEISGHHNFKTASGSKVVSHQWWFSTFTRPKVYLLIRHHYPFYRKHDPSKIRVTFREFSLWMRAA